MRCEIIAAAASSFDNETHMDSVMLELTKVDKAMALETIAKIIQSPESTATGAACAKAIYEHMMDKSYSSVKEVLDDAKIANSPSPMGDDTGRLEWMMYGGTEMDVENVQPAEPLEEHPPAVLPDN